MLYFVFPPLLEDVEDVVICSVLMEMILEEDINVLLYTKCYTTTSVTLH